MRQQLGTKVEKPRLSLRQHLMTSTMLCNTWIMSHVIPTGKATGQIRTTLANLFMGSM